MLPVSRLLNCLVQKRASLSFSLSRFLSLSLFFLKGLWFDRIPWGGGGYGGGGCRIRISSCSPSNGGEYTAAVTPRWWQISGWMGRACVRASGSDNVLKLPVSKISEEGVLSVNPGCRRSRVMRATRAAAAAERSGWGGGREGRHIAAVRKGLKHHRFNLGAQSQLQIMPPPLKRFCRRSGLDDPR